MNAVSGKEDFRELAEIQPPKWSTSHRAVVKIEAIDIEVSNQLPIPHLKTETASKGGLDPTGEAIGVVLKG